MRIVLRVLLAAVLVSGLVSIDSQLLNAASPRAGAFPKPAVDESIAASKGHRETAVLSGGCFWGVQAVFEHTRGVISATSGYAGGEAKNAHYELVGNGNTGHAESVQIVYEPSQITYGQILMIFFSVAHNPTELNKQGPDWGPQYRSSIFYVDEEQKKIANAYIAQLDGAKVYGQKIVTQVVPLKGFYVAESYHQDYVKHHPDNPYITINDLPKLANLKKQFPELYREN
ncbi:MAG TPA: peptide-methionine (S)-S-oxide reductase MsrA [Candidatus Acidoferrum sp.]|jgi:peptide-methionine (S)-S-oxide reductase